MAKTAKVSRKKRQAALELPFAVRTDADGNPSMRIADGAFLTVGGQMRGGVATIRVQSSKLDRYHRRGQINDRQYSAGIKFHDLWNRASIKFRVTSIYDEKSSRRPRGSGGDIAQLDNAYDARNHIDRVLERTGLAIRLDPEEPLRLSEERVTIQPSRGPLRIQPAGWVVINVCGFDEWAGGATKLVMLRNGLRMLADYWRIPDEG